MRVDLPEPETPVMHIKRPKGNSTFIFFKLCSEAPKIFIDLPLPMIRFSGILIFFRPDK